MGIINVVALLVFVVMVSGGIPLNQQSDNDPAGESDQLVSGTTIDKSIVPQVAATANSANGRDLKTSDSFGLGYYLPIVSPALVKYHYPLLYYHPAFIHSIRHHGYGGFGYYHHGHGVIH